MIRGLGCRREIREGSSLEDGEDDLWEAVLQRMLVANAAWPTEQRSTLHRRPCLVEHEALVLARDGMHHGKCLLALKHPSIRLPHVEQTGFA